MRCSYKPLIWVRGSRSDTCKKRKNGRKKEKKKKRSISRFSSCKTGEVVCILENNQNKKFFFATFLLTFSLYFTTKPHLSIVVYFDQRLGAVHALLYEIVTQVSKANNMLSKYSVWLQPQKTHFLLHFSCFFSFFTFFMQKAHFDQRLACGAPKRWSKYTTLNLICAMSIIFKCLILCPLFL